MRVTERTHGLEHGLTNYGDRDFSLYLRRSFAQSMGYSRAMLSKPVVGIAYTPSGFNNCHRHFPELLDAVKRGVLAAGALPVAFPTISLGEVFLSPTSLKYRNLMSIDTEEMIRAQPMDAVVLMGGCDKTVPAQLMGAVSAGRPAILLVAGPMMTGRHRRERPGPCTDCRRFWARYRAGDVTEEEISQVEGQLAVTAGTCAVMGTASTMACIAEALGLVLPGTAAIPAVHADRLPAAEATGAAAARLIGSQPTPGYVDRLIIACRDQPFEPQGGLVALFGYRAPKGAILKRSAADAKLFEHTGRAVVFSSLADLAARIDDPALDVTPQDVLVLQNAGPHASECMPEAGYLPIPKKLAQRGVKDMIRVSDARMSGTAFGTIVLHVTPDSASGGPLGLVRSGDRIRLSVEERRIDLLVEEVELKARAAAIKPTQMKPERGYAKLYAQEILGADDGCDFAFLRPAVGAG